MYIYVAIAIILSLVINLVNKIIIICINGIHINIQYLSYFLVVAWECGGSTELRLLYFA